MRRRLGRPWPGLETTGEGTGESGAVGVVGGRHASSFPREQRINGCSIAHKEFCGGILRWAHKASGKIVQLLRAIVSFRPRSK